MIHKFLYGAKQTVHYDLGRKTEKTDPFPKEEDTLM